LFAAALELAGLMMRNPERMSVMNESNRKDATLHKPRLFFEAFAGAAEAAPFQNEFKLTHCP